MPTKFKSGNLNGRNHLADLFIYGRIILKLSGRNNSAG
jgi:hypothetical protein